MHKTKKLPARLLSVLLTLCMVLTLLPTTALADEPTPVYSATMADVNLGSAKPGYDYRDYVKNPEIRNTGNQTLFVNGSSLTISDNDYFDFNRNSTPVVIAVGYTSTSWYVRPKADLAPNTYTATLTFTDTAGKLTPVTATVTFTVLAADQCGISFDANSGTGTQADHGKVVDENTNYTLPDCTFTAPANKEFGGWEVGGVTKQPGETITVTTDVTIKAIWKSETTYNITFTDDYGTAYITAGVPVTQAAEGTTVTIKAADRTAEGMTFDRWTVESGGVTLANASSAETTFIMKSSAVTLKANYITTPIYSATMADVNLGSAKPGYDYRDYVKNPEIENTGNQRLSVNGDSLTISDNDYFDFDCSSVPSNISEGYTNTSWWVRPKADLAPNTYTATLTFTDTAGKLTPVTATVTFTVLAADQCGISFDANSGTGTQADHGKVVDEDTSYTLPDCTFTAPSGKEFGGWEVGGVTKQPGETITVTTDVTIKAIWKSETTYNITFTDDYGTAYIAAGVPVTKAAEGTTVTIKAADRTAESKTFDRWTVESGSIDLANANSAETTFVMKSSDVTLTANYVTTPIYSATMADVNLGSAKPGYSVSAHAKNPEIENTGNQRLSVNGDSLTISENDYFDFGISSVPSNISVGVTNTSWWVRPKAGLTPGPYTATLTFTDKEGKLTPVTATVTFTVSDHNFNTAVWKSDSSTHWHPCTDTGCPAKGSEAPHDSSVTKNQATADFNNDGYTGDKHCSVCDYKTQTGKAIPAGKYILESSATMAPAAITSSICANDLVFTSLEPAKYTVKLFRVFDRTNTSLNTSGMGNNEYPHNTNFISEHEYAIEFIFEAVAPYVYEEARDGYTSTFILNNGETETSTVSALSGSVNRRIVLTANAVPVVPVISVTLNKSALTLLQGTNETLTATVKPDTATNKEVSWSSSDTSVAVVDVNGKITATKAGTAVITVKSKSDVTKSAQCTVTVLNEFGITVTGGAASVSGSVINKAAKDTIITLTANVPTGERFVRWETTSGSATVSFVDANSATATFKMPNGSVKIKAVTVKEVAVPIANTGLKYDGTEKTGVNAGTGYTLTGHKKTSVDNYTAQATLAEGYIWADGSTGVKNISWSIAKGDQGAPAGLTAMKPTSVGASDGKITGVTTAMEYRKTDSASWIACTGTQITGLAAGSYEVRYKETANYNAGATYTVTVTDGAVQTYVLTITNGTGSGSYAANATVTITANAPAAGKVFDKWVVTAGNADIDNVNSASATVTTKAGHATITAIYKDQPSATYAVTVNGSYATTTGAGSYAKDAPVNIYAGSRSSYSFSGWEVVSGGVTLANPNSASTSFTMPAGAVTVKANWTYNGGGSGGGGGGGSSYDYYTVKASAGAGGSITPSGSVSIREGRDKTFTVTPQNGYVIADVTVDGKSVGAVKTYTFTDVAKAHTIKATFKAAGGHTNPQTGVDMDFVDVQDGDWFYENVAYVFDKGLMQGTSETTFSPYIPTTRGMIVTILYRVAGEPKVTEAVPFLDVTSGKYYAQAIAWAYENKVVNGYNAEQFGPEDTITREQLAAILMNYAKLMGYDVTAAADLNKFADAGQISGYAQQSMAWANAEGLINGKGNGVLDPQGKATRAEAAAILHRFCENIAK